MWTGYQFNDDLAAEAKVFLNPSPWGINGGRISKLNVYRWISDDWEVFYEYDRGGVVGDIDADLLARIIAKWN